MPYFFPKQISLALSALLLAAASSSAQVLSPVYSFSDTNGIDSAAGLLLSGSTLYGTTSTSTTSGGRGASASAAGTVFKVNTDGSGFTNLHVFSADYSGPFPITNTDGGDSDAQLVLSGNRLYGTASKGGFKANGMVFAVNTDGTGFTNLYNFGAVYNSTNTDGASPSTGLVLSGDTLYGTTEGGGFNANGTVFAIHTDGTGFTNLYSFTNNVAGLKSLILSGNTLYGTTDSGGSSANGTVFALNTDGTGFTNLHSFSSLVRETTPPYVYTNSDGANPQVGLVLSGNKLYGTTRKGGTGGSGGDITAGGTVFALNTDGTGFRILHSFNAGANPYGGLVLSGNTLYGATRYGGNLSQQNGTIFAVNMDGTGFATVHTFTPIIYDSLSLVYTNADGSAPNAGMILSGTTLYGTTTAGGTNGIGTVFALDLAVAPPTIQFTATPTNGVPPLPVQFSSPVVDSGGNAILGWNWNFGDGSNSIVQNPSYIYTNTATFFPTLICINNNGSTVIGSGPAIVAAYPRSILNGGFETGTFTNWTQSGLSYSGVATGSTYAHAGKYGAALETGGTMGFLSETLITTPGVVYIISFWLDNPHKYTVTNDFQVSWNGNVLLDKTNLTAIGWTNIQLTVTATESVSTLQFGYLNGYFYFGLDDVSVLPVAQLGISGISLAGANLVLTGSGGLSNRTYHVLSGTNLTEPFNQWTPVSTNVAGADGNFNLTATNAVTPNAPQQFYILQLQ